MMLRVTSEVLALLEAVAPEYLAELDGFERKEGGSIHVTHHRGRLIIDQINEGLESYRVRLPVMVLGLHTLALNERGLRAYETVIESKVRGKM